MMLAYIPYVQQPSIQIGPLTLAAFGAIVVGSGVVGMALGTRRFAALGLDPELAERFAWWAVAGGFLGAHLFSVLFYFPQKVAANPWILLKVWEDISSFGGILGGSLAIAIFLSRYAAHLDASTRWAFVDTAAYAFPISLTLGRVACTLAHDHPGSITRFPLAISLEEPAAQAFIARTYAAAGRVAELPDLDVLRTMAFHDLGWYELLVLALVILPVMLLRERREHRTGVHHAGRALVTFIACYMPVRFALDFLRVSDVRYAGLTPAQWAALAALGALPVIIAKSRAVPARPFGDPLERPAP